jgi:hypothetical protein
MAEVALAAEHQIVAPQDIRGALVLQAGDELMLVAHRDSLFW